jgi:malonyl-CoA O-methyltransferase
VTEKQKINKQQVRQHFSCHAKDYDRYAVVQQSVAKSLARRLAAIGHSWRRGLEVGCGTGMLSRELLTLQPDSQLVLSDIAHGMSHYIQQLIPQSPVCDADAAALPFVAGSFDLFASSSVYQWLNDLPNAFAEISRVLTPGGGVALALFGEKTLYELRGSHQAALPAEKMSHVQSFPAVETIAEALADRFDVLQLESEFEVEWHADVPALLRSLKKIGAQNASQDRPQGLASRRVMQKMVSHYNESYAEVRGIPATYEVIYLLARKR